MLRPTGRSSAVSEEVVDDWISFVESYPQVQGEGSTVTVYGQQVGAVALLLKISTSLKRLVENGHRSSPR